MPQSPIHDKDPYDVADYLRTPEEIAAHIILKKEQDGEVIGCVVPLHRQLAVGTLKDILKQAQLTYYDRGIDTWQLTKPKKHLLNSWSNGLN